MRPDLHYTPAANWLSDPNGLIHVAGEWHLFYQYNPHGDQWGHMAWGHAVSRDLYDWTERPPALVEDDTHAIFSGSAVVDTHDTAGFGAGALVAIYTGAAHAGGQAQCLAASVDNGRTWSKFADNPVLDRGLADFRDPNVFWHDGTARWIMVVALSAENRALLFVSADLKAWAEIGAIGPFDVPGDVWECPLLIDLPVEGTTGSRWLFKVDVMRGAPGSGAIAVVGDFDGDAFTPDRRPDGGVAWAVIDHGRDFYAAIAWGQPRDAAGRPAWVGWMGNHTYQAALPAHGWRGAMSLPRRLALRRGATGDRLVQSVERAFAVVAVGAFPQATVTLPACVCIDRAIGTVSLRLGDAAAAVTLTVADGRLFCDRGAGIDPAFDAPVDAPWPDGPLMLWLDHGTLEVEGGAGTAWCTLQHGLAGATLDFAIASDTPVDGRIERLVRSPRSGVC